MGSVSRGAARVSEALITVIVIFVAAFILLLALFSFGWIDINWPWEDLVEQKSEVGVDVVEEGPAEIVRIQPIALDCRARIQAEVPVIGKQSTQLAGQTISTDTVRMRAVGDVDTCVEASGVDIRERDDGTISVVIQADAIRFERPRVDAIATMDSVTTDRGIINQLYEILPLTNEDDELTIAAVAFAQTVIGGSSCMQAAYDETRLAIIAAYRQQLVEQGGSADDIDVVISGAPDFSQNDVATAALGEFEFIEEAGTSCVVRQ